MIVIHAAHFLLLIEFFINSVLSAFFMTHIDGLAKFDAERANHPLIRVLEFIIEDSRLNRCVIVLENQQQQHHDNDTLDGIIQRLQKSISITIMNTNG